MINNISWQSYWISIALISAGYYCLIYLLYYQNDFKVWLGNTSDGDVPIKGSTNPTIEEKTVEQPLVADENSSFQLPPKETEEYMVYACIDEINAYLEEAKKSRCVKKEMIQSLRTLLRKYPTIKKSEYKESLNNVLIAQCEKVCAIQLKEEDVVHVWFD